MSFTLLEQRLESLLDEVSGRKDIHSATMALASGRDDFRWAGARGELSPGGAATTPDMPWFTASITKLFIAGAVMRMVEDPPQVLHEPRVRIRYSDTNYQLLMGIVEERRSASFAQALEELVLGPLGLDDTWTPGHPRGEKPRGEVATLYAGREVVEFPRFFASIGDLNSTADDLIQFLIAVPEGAPGRHGVPGTLSGGASGSRPMLWGSPHGCPSVPEGETRAGRGERSPDYPNKVRTVTLQVAIGGASFASAVLRWRALRGEVVPGDPSSRHPPIDLTRSCPFI